MIAVRVYEKAALEKALSVYKCRMVGSIAGGAELWQTGWGTAFTLYNDQGYYDEWQYREVLAFIAKDMPPDWHERNGNGGGSPK